MRASIFFFLMVHLVSCSSSLQDLRADAEKVTKELTQELAQVQKKDDLLVRLPKIKKKYLHLARLVYKTHLLLKNDHEIGFEQAYPSHAGYLLYRELVRICEIKGAKELIKQAQKDALAYLQEKMPSK